MVCILGMKIVNLGKNMKMKSYNGGGLYVEQSVAMNMSKLLDVDRKEEAKENCRNVFWTIVLPCRTIAKNEFLKVYDWYDEHHLLRFQNKKWLETIKRDFDKYDDYLFKEMDVKARNLVYDLCNKVYGGVEKELLDLNLTFKFYFERKGIKDSEIKAQIENARAMMNLFQDAYDKLFELYVKEYHWNFKNDYKEADLSVGCEKMWAFSDGNIHFKKFNLHPTKNYASEQAYIALNEKLGNADFLDEQSLEALKLNHFEKEVKECELNKMGADRLADKFKVTRK